VRLSDGVVLYGYAANVETKDPAILAWVSENGAFAGDRRALLNVAGLPAQSTPDLLQTFFGP
jgi:hypothetical protein